MYVFVPSGPMMAVSCSRVPRQKAASAKAKDRKPLMKPQVILRPGNSFCFATALKLPVFWCAKFEFKGETGREVCDVKCLM